MDSERPGWTPCSAKTFVVFPDGSMPTAIVFLFLILSISASRFAQAANDGPDLREALAKEFQGTYRFYYLFSESGIPYVDVTGHLQLLESDSTTACRASRSLIKPARVKSAPTTATSSIRRKIN
jgi:hypothetical protein